MQTKTIPILALLFCCCSMLSAQEESDDSRTTELGLNITNTLSGFLNSGGQTAPLDPYLISLKSIKNNKGLRVGLNFKVRNTDEREDFFSGSRRKTKEIEANFRVGFEKRIPISPRFKLYWGIDAIIQFEKDKVEFFSFNGRIDLDENIYGFGGGPVLGIMFYLNQRVYLSTESYIYGVYRIGKQAQLLDTNNPSPLESEIKELDIIPVYPNALYVTFLF